MTPFILIPIIEKDESIAIGFCGTQSAYEKAIANLTGRYHLEKELGYTINIENGSSVYESNCAACHSFNREVVGPSLSGLRSKLGESSALWLQAYLTDSEKLLNTGDTRAVKLRKEYGHVSIGGHSDSSYSDTDQKDLIGFLLLVEKGF